ncbi:hypothetical protein GM3708_3042 [Geminocystis sp. NIES-3708]|nr:hypothetical protein GM3708_3042 [Geminocystis sp. NIES-3708]
MSTVFISLIGIYPEIAQAKDKDKGKEKEKETISSSSTVLCSTANLTTSILCEGPFSGNDSNSNLDGIFGLNNWTEFAKVDDDNGTDKGLTVTGGGTSGGWSLDLGGDGSHKYSGVMAVLKGGPSYSAYLLGLDVLDNFNFLNGTWNTDGIYKGNGDPNPGLSHFTIYTTGKMPIRDVPEPLTILGTGLALGFGGLFKKQQDKRKNT